jgi:hypothetical protein
LTANRPPSICGLTPSITTRARPFVGFADVAAEVRNPAASGLRFADFFGVLFFAGVVVSVAISFVAVSLFSFSHAERCVPPVPTKDAG